LYFDTVRTGNNDNNYRVHDVTISDIATMTTTIDFPSSAIYDEDSSVDSSSSAIYDGDSSAGNDSPTAVMVEPYDMNTTLYLAVIDAESSADDKDSSICDEDSSAVTMMTTTVPVTYEATSSVVRTTTSNELPSAGNDFPIAVTLKTYDTAYDLYFDTVVAIVVAVAPAVAVGAPSVVMTCTTAVPVITKIYFANFDEDSSADSSSSANYDEDSSAGNDSPAIIMTTTALYELPSAIHDGIISTDNDAVSSAAITMMTNNMDTAVYLAVIDAESSTDITNTITLYESPSYDIDTESSAVSIADEATTTDSCHSSNYFSLISSRQFDQITSVLSTLMSLHRTLHLILNSLLLLIQ